MLYSKLAPRGAVTVMVPNVPQLTLVVAVAVEVVAVGVMVEVDVEAVAEEIKKTLTKVKKFMC